MVKVGGNEIYVRYVITYKFYEIRREHFAKVGRKKNFPKYGGKKL